MREDAHPVPEARRPKALPPTAPQAVRFEEPDLQWLTTGAPYLGSSTLTITHPTSQVFSYSSSDLSTGSNALTK